MRFIDDFRNAEHVKALAGSIERRAAQAGRPLRFMEVCGGHTMAIHRFGLPQLLPESVELLSGPGCPVCVTPTTYIDRAIELGRDGALLTTFGDLYRVPGSERSVEGASAAGLLEALVVYSPRDALRAAQDSHDREVVFLAIGFETTAPTVAATLLEAKRLGLRNFRVLSGHKTMPRALRALLEAPEVAIDGFILPGHVCTITGARPFTFIPDEFGVPCCVTGFEPADILASIEKLTELCGPGRRPALENAYRRAVRPDGNEKALALLERVMVPVDAQWRGIGHIPGSGLDLGPQWLEFRVEPPDPERPSAEYSACRCGDVLRGLIKPAECSLFGEVCTPDSPVGPCMVSSEGSCAAHFKYGSQTFTAGFAEIAENGKGY